MVRIWVWGGAGVIMTSYSLPEADRTHIGQPGRKEATDGGAEQFMRPQASEGQSRNTSHSAGY